MGVALAATFVTLALIHVYWAFAGVWGRTAGVPSVQGKPLFRPSRFATLLVAAGLLVATSIVSGAAGWLGGAGPNGGFRVLTLGISMVFLLRAIGDWKYVGFSRRFTDSAFAYWDIRLYSPLCVLIALAALVLAWAD
jgi:hypothetical protein